MQQTVICSNADCGMSVPVPEGSNQLVCPHCNTWQIVSTSGPGPGADIFSDPADDPFTLDDPLVDDTPGTVDLEPEEEINPFAEDEFEAPAPAAPVTPSAPAQTPAAEEPATAGFLQTQTGEKMELRFGVNSIGRAGTDLIIHDLSVSRTHCFIEVIKDQTGIRAEIYDAGFGGGKPSTNGVFLGGRTQRLEPHERVPLKQGEALVLGRVNLWLFLNLHI